MSWTEIGLAFAAGGSIVAFLYHGLNARILLHAQGVADKFHCASNDLYFAQRERDALRERVKELEGELDVERRLAEDLYDRWSQDHTCSGDDDSLDAWRKQIEQEVKS